MVNQKWGVVDLDAGNLLVRGSLDHEQILNEDWSVDAGIDLVGANSSNYGKAWVQQIYGRANWKIWRLDIGSREDYTSSLNPRLSSGDFSKSNNARPIPEIKGSIPNFIQIPYTKGNMYIKGDIAVGYYLDSQWKEDLARPHNQDYTTKLLSHHKSVSFRFGEIETKNRMQFTVEMDHVAVWGGNLYKYEAKQEKYGINHQPHSITEFLRMAIAKEGSSSASGGDQIYVAGSQWGSYLFKYDYKLKNEDQLSLYIHHFFDDGSGMTFENYRDNMLGLEYKAKKKSGLSGAVFEYVYTKQQTGPIHFNTGMDDEHRDRLISKGNGNDNYYNNFFYIQGPSYFGKTIGTPLLLSPEYNRDGSLNFKSSRIIAFHIGLEGYFHPAFQYRLLFTSGQSWGRYNIPFTAVKEGFASQLELIYACPQVTGLALKLAAGYDQGEFFGGDTFGGGLTVSKQGVFYFK
ncbi:hypothetical protein FACS1894123_05480 [Bacteroidia bacterium]|nr:hypothetical protein FACS1894123_05480 [Bacteroidia bacterium]